jgi:hypothetical protein
VLGSLGSTLWPVVSPGPEDHSASLWVIKKTVACSNLVVRAFTPQEIMDAIDVRGVLEGLAARMVADQGPPRRLIQSLHECLREDDEIFAKRHLVESMRPATAR